MGRSKEYARDEVLEAATQVFWEKGYQGTSVGDLVEGTGLHRRSMYEEFSDVSGPQFKGCLLVKSAIEQGLLNVDARQKLHSFLAASENAFYKCLDAAQQEGEIPQNSDCRTLAKYLMCPGGCDGVGTDESIKE